MLIQSILSNVIVIVVAIFVSAAANVALSSSCIHYISGTVINTGKGYISTTTTRTVLGMFTAPTAIVNITHSHGSVRVL